MHFVVFYSKLALKNKNDIYTRTINSCKNMFYFPYYTQ